MKKWLIIIFIILFLIVVTLFSYDYFSKKEVNTAIKKTNPATTIKEERKEDIMEGITLNYHSSIRIEKDNKVIYFDPYKIEDEKKDASYIFITHSHYDHFSLDDIKKIMKDDTRFVVTSDIEEKVISIGIKKENLTVVYPNETHILGDIKFDTIPAYNINSTYHKRSYNWVGYNVEIDNIKYYITGDTDATDELKKIDCNVMFIPVGGTYTMTYDEAVQAVNEIKPQIAVPIHYGEVGKRSDAENFVSKLNGDIKGIILK